MSFQIPFVIHNSELKKISKTLSSKIPHKKKSKLNEYLKNADVTITREEYIATCFTSSITYFLVLSIIFILISVILEIDNPVRNSFLLSFFAFLFINSNQFLYPKVYVSRKQKDIERNLVPALDDILIQLNSGIPLFSVMINIANSDYGLLSNEFKKAVKRISAGEPEVEVLDDLGRKNPSVFFKRTLWQISNGLRAGSDIAIVIKNNIKLLNEEQIIQIQNYGSTLNPLTVFYMLVSIIMPALSVTYLTVILSMMNVSKEIAMTLFIGFFVMISIIQIVFLGIIKSRRPSLA